MIGLIKALKIITPQTSFGGIDFKRNSDDEFNAYLSQLLYCADTGISQVKTETIPLSEVPGQTLERIRDELDEQTTVLIKRATDGARISLKKINGEIMAYKLITVHKCEDSDREFTLN